MIEDQPLSPSLFREVVLRRYQMAFQRAVSSEVVAQARQELGRDGQSESPTLDMLENTIYGSYVWHLRDYVMGKQLAYEEIRYPATWWDAFKLRWYPAWMLRRWPAREIVKTFDAKALYPGLEPIADTVVYLRAEIDTDHGLVYRHGGHLSGVS